MQTPSVKPFFNRKTAPTLAPSSKSTSEMGKPEPVVVVCQQLCGEEYNEYVLRTMTRSLGGVSARKRAQIIRDLFPYKSFLRINTALIDEKEGWSEGDVESEDDVQVKCEVPEYGNKHVSSTKWTETELKRHDEALRGWARWEVDYGAKVVRSTKCQGTTTNKGGICRECVAVSKDESFKAEVRKVFRPMLHRCCSYTEPRYCNRKIVKQRCR
jgi:hypothetical protein